MAEFTPEGAAVRVHLEEQEADLIRRLLDELSELIRAESAGDPVTERLFPKAYEDRREQASYQELVGDQLRGEKLAAINAMASVLQAGTDVDTSIPPAEIAAWLPVLTDLRLAIGTQLNVDEAGMDRQIDPDDPEAARMSVLHWLGWMEESVLDCLRVLEAR